jgi:CheY-like chemotaxis protein
MQMGMTTIIKKDKTGTTLVSKPTKKALVVDDAVQVTDMLRSMLGQLGYHVEVSVDGRDALMKYKPGKYDLIVTDYAMPKMNGIELAHIIKDRAPAQPIMMVTGFAFTIAAYDMRPVPVDAILRKPFDVKQVKESLENLNQPGRRPQEVPGNGTVASY